MGIGLGCRLGNRFGNGFGQWLGYANCSRAGALDLRTLLLRRGAGIKAPKQAQRIRNLGRLDLLRVARLR